MRSPRTAALAALLVAVVAVGTIVVRSSAGGTYTLRAVFSSVNGLVTTGKVEVAGFRVGEITGIDVRIGGYPVVTMEVSNAYRVRQGAHAVIELGSLAGQLNRYIALTGGTGPKLPDGATIPLTRTSAPVEIDQFLSVLTPKVRSEMRQLLHETVFTLRGHGPDIEQTLRHSAQAFAQVAGLLGDVSADAPALQTLVTRAADGARELAAEPADVQATITRLAAVLDVTARRQSAVTQTLQQLAPTMSAVRAAMLKADASSTTFSRLLSAAGPALTAIDPFARSLRVTAPLSVPVLRGAQQLIAALRNASPELERLFGAPLPQTLRNFDSTLSLLNPVLDEGRAHAPDALGWLPLQGQMTANYAANGHGGLVLAFPRPALQRPLKSGDCSNGWLLRPFDRLPGQLACDTWTGYGGSFVGGGKPDTSYFSSADQRPWPGEFGG